MWETTGQTWEIPRVENGFHWGANSETIAINQEAWWLEINCKGNEGGMKLPGSRDVWEKKLTGICEE